MGIPLRAVCASSWSIDVVHRVCCQRKLEERIERNRRNVRDLLHDISTANELNTRLRNDNITFHMEVNLLLDDLTTPV